jgi:hypothetical protein
MGKTRKYAGFSRLSEAGRGKKAAENDLSIILWDDDRENGTLLYSQYPR